MTAAASEQLTLRQAACQACPHFRTGQVHAETWCAALDDQPAARNCEGARHGRWQARVTAAAATCGMWDPDPNWLYLPGIKTVVYTTDKPHCVARHPRVKAMLDGFGFRDWSFFWGQPGTPYWQMIRSEYAALLRDNDPPFTILEDDIAVRDYRPWIKVPAGSEVVYLGGGGSWPGGQFVRLAQHHLPGHKIYRVREIGWEDLPGTDEWVRVFGMFGTHAIVYRDKRVMLEMADAIERDTVQVDVIFGKNQWRWQCVLRKIPMWWQDDGHNNNGTYDYSARAGEPESREERIARLRARRRKILGIADYTSAIADEEEGKGRKGEGEKGSHTSAIADGTA